MKVNVLEEKIRLASQKIMEGELVIFPTETVYGLGANALNPIAVEKIFKLKERPHFNPLIVHIASLEQLKDLTTEFDNPQVLHLAKSFWPGPLTLVVEKTENIPDIVTGGLPTVAIRMPDNPIALSLIEKSGKPIAAPSANKFGQLSPTRVEQVYEQFPGFENIIDGGETKVGIESTIIKIEKKGCKLLRPGVITREELGKVITVLDEKVEKILAPGMIKSHYSPKKPIFLLSKVDLEKVKDYKIGFIGLSKSNYSHFEKEIYPPKENDLKDYATILFSSIFELEKDKNVDIIVVEDVVEEGIGIAIMDRMKKAAYQYEEKLNKFYNI